MTTTPRRATIADHATVATPVGPFTAIVDDDGAVLAAGWTADAEVLRSRIARSLRPAGTRARADLGAVTAAIAAFHAGDATPALRVPVRQRSGPFVEHTWDVLRLVPAGSLVSYTELARRAGRPDAVRAAANACARNGAALFVPCHRVVRSDGSLGGFRWGLELKARLLELEHARLAA